MTTKLTTITGKPITVVAACRLPIKTYEQAQQRASKEGMSLGAMLASWVREKLESETGEVGHNGQTA